MSLSVKLPNGIEGLDEGKGVSDFMKDIQRRGDRDMLFFDETVLGYVIYEGDQHEERTVTSCFVEVSVAPQSSVEFGLGNRDPQRPFEGSDEDKNVSVNLNLAEKDILYNCTTDGGKRIILWKFEFSATYPRKRFENPRYLLSCFYDLKKASQTAEIEHDSKNDDILPDYKPAHGRNLFKELNNKVTGDPVPESSVYTFIDEATVEEKQSQSMVEAESTAGEIEESTLLSSHMFIPVSATLIIKLKSTKPAGKNNVLLASLNIETSDEMDLFSQPSSDSYYFHIERMNMDFTTGIIEKVGNFEVPVRFQLQESLCLTYRLINQITSEREKSLDVHNSSPSKTVQVTLSFRVQKFDSLSSSFKSISNLITTQWSPIIDFFMAAPPINNALKTSNNFTHSQVQGLTYANRSTTTRKAAIFNNLQKSRSSAVVPTITSNGIASGQSYDIKKKVDLINSTSPSSVTVILSTNGNSSLSGLKLTFTGKLTIKLGEVVSWKVQAINDSNNRLNLSLLAQNAVNFNPIYRNSSDINLASSQPSVPATTKTPQAYHNYTKAQVHSIYQNLKLHNSGIIVLNNDVRIGPLWPFSVFETEIKLIGLSQGIFNIDGLKIFDVNSGDGIDFGKLLEVFVM